MQHLDASSCMKRCAFHCARPFPPRSRVHAVPLIHENAFAIDGQRPKLVHDSLFPVNRSPGVGSRGIEPRLCFRDLYDRCRPSSRRARPYPILSTPLLSRYTFMLWRVRQAATVILQDGAIRNPWPIAALFMALAPRYRSSIESNGTGFEAAVGIDRNEEDSAALQVWESHVLPTTCVHSHRSSPKGIDIQSPA